MGYPALRAVLDAALALGMMAGVFSLKGVCQVRIVKPFQYGDFAAV